MAYAKVMAGREDELSELESLLMQLDYEDALKLAASQPLGHARIGRSERSDRTRVASLRFRLYCEAHGNADDPWRDDPLVNGARRQTKRTSTPDRWIEHQGGRDVTYVTLRDAEDDDDDDLVPCSPFGP